MSTCCTIALALPLAIAAPAPLQDGPWAGKRIIVKDSDTRMSHRMERADGRKGIELWGTSYMVLAHRDDFLQIRQDGKTGWIPQEKAVLAEEALDYFNDLIKKKPGVADYYRRRAVARNSTGNSANSKEAIEDLKEATRLDPEDAASWRYLGQMFRIAGKNDEALEALNKSIELKPTAMAHADRGNVYFQSGPLDLAMKDLNEAIQINPEYAPSYTTRGIIHFNLGKYQQSLSDHDQMIRLEPESPAGYNNKADALACCPDASVRDGTKAVELAKKACELSKWKDSTTLDTLACAYAEAGQFDEAVKWVKKALQVESTRIAYKTRGEMLLELFEAKRPYHYPE